jgi:hypothetical protein
MKRYVGLMLLVLTSAPTNSTNSPFFISELHWMAGCWAPDGRERGSVEQWMAPAGNAMLGMSRIMRDGEMIAFEYMRIVEQGSSLRLIASPSGQDTAEFSMKHLGDSVVIFENLQHDFPQQIMYQLVDSEHMLGRIEGMTSSGKTHIEFPMTRTSCTTN